MKKIKIDLNKTSMYVYLNDQDDASKDQAICIDLDGRKGELTREWWTDHLGSMGIDAEFIPDILEELTGAYTNTRQFFLEDN